MWPFTRKPTVADHILHETRLLRSELQSFATYSAHQFTALRKEHEAIMSLGQDIIGELQALKALTLEENTEVQEKLAALEARLEAETVSEEERAEISSLIADLKQQIEGISEPAAETPAE